MGAVLMIFLTLLTATVMGAVMLIQAGGWLHILVAILLILGNMLYTSVFIIIGDELRSRKKALDILSNFGKANNKKEEKP